MDTIDALLFDAWHRIGARLRRDRLAAVRRSRRRFGAINHPPRAWCLAVRASDTRINAFHAVIHPPHAEEDHQPHDVLIDGRLIRRLTAPVMIPPPGVSYQQAADVLGRDYQTLAYWAYHGVFCVERPPGFRRPLSGLPRVWTPSPIDPNSFRGRPPHPVWGTLWQHLHEDFPENFAMTVQRVPRWRRNTTGRSIWHGWYFICPGRMILPSSSGGRGAGGEGKNPPENGGERDFIHIPCGRRCTYLFAPQSIWTLAQSMDDQRGFDVGDGDRETAAGGSRGGVGAWLPGSAASDPTKSRGPRSFACSHCWKVRGETWADDKGGGAWNSFITHISGGLLYGHDVPRPLAGPDAVPIVRRKAYRAKPTQRGTPRRKEADQRAIVEAKEKMRKQRVRKDKGVKRGPRTKREGAPAGRHVEGPFSAGGSQR